MKKYLPLLLAFSMSSYAQNMTAEIKQGLALLANPSSFLKPEHCEPGKPDTAQWCGKAFSWSCIVDASKEKEEKFIKKMNSFYDNVDFEEDSKASISAAYMKSISAAEKDMYNGNLKSQDLNKFFNEQKDKLVQIIKEQPISASKQDDLVRRVRETQLLTPTQYISKLEASGIKDNPTIPKDEIKEAAIESYTETCGDASHKKEIFYQSGMIVICPGKILSLQESHVKSKEEALDALTLLLGRAIGQSIDADEEPTVYKNMGNCFKKLFNNPKAWDKEIAASLSADFWSAQLFSARLMSRGIKGHDVIKTIAHAVQDPYCYTNYQTNAIRIDKIISLTPGTRELMACGKTSEAPACGL